MYLTLNMMIGEPVAKCNITWDEGGKYMLIKGAWMDIVGFNLETQKPCSPEKRQTIQKNSFKLRIEIRRVCFLIYNCMHSAKNFSSTQGIPNRYW
jgi:hypothetical protein